MISDVLNNQYSSLLCSTHVFHLFLLALRADVMDRLASLALSQTVHFPELNIWHRVHSQTTL